MKRSLPFVCPAGSPDRRQGRFHRRIPYGFLVVLFFLSPLPCNLFPLFAVEEIAHYTLDEDSSISVVAETGYVTSLVFPGPISDVSGGSISPDNPQAEFMVQWDPGSPSVKIKPRFPNSTTNLNLTYGGKVYVINLATGEKGTRAVYFENNKPTVGTRVETASPGDAPAAVHSGNTGPAPALTVTQLLALLDRSKEFDLLARYAPKFIKGTYRAFPRRVFEYNHFTASLLEVIRWDAADTLIFKVALESKDETPWEYDPEEARVRLHNRLFPTSIRDMEGVIPPKGKEAIAWLGITGTLNDQRNNLAPGQEWTILIQSRPFSEGKVFRESTSPISHARKFAQAEEDLPPEDEGDQPPDETQDLGQDPPGNGDQGQEDQTQDQEPSPDHGGEEDVQN